MDCMFSCFPFPCISYLRWRREPYQAVHVVPLDPWCYEWLLRIQEQLCWVRPMAFLVQQTKAKRSERGHCLHPWKTLLELRSEPAPRGDHYSKGVTLLPDWIKCPGSPGPILTQHPCWSAGAQNGASCPTEFTSRKSSSHGAPVPSNHTLC